MLEMASREAQLAENLIAKQRQSDVLLLEISELAAQLAETNHFDDEGFNSPMTGWRLTCNLTKKAPATQIPSGPRAPPPQEACRALRAVRMGLPMRRPTAPTW